MARVPDWFVPAKSGVSTPEIDATIGAILAAHAESERQRALLEVRMVRYLMRELTKGGYRLSVDDGEETIRGSEKELLEAIFGVDDSWLIAERGINERQCIFLVRGNDGHDIINDHTGGLNDLMQPVMDYADRLADESENSPPHFPDAIARCHEALRADSGASLREALLGLLRALGEPITELEEKGAA